VSLLSLVSLQSLVSRAGFQAILALPPPGIPEALFPFGIIVA
jgi:hypothetical protein